MTVGVGYNNLVDFSRPHSFCNFSFRNLRDQQKWRYGRSGGKKIFFFLLPSSFFLLPSSFFLLPSSFVTLVYPKKPSVGQCQNVLPLVE
jgi:hypothetical protein